MLVSFFRYVLRKDNMLKSSVLFNNCPEYNIFIYRILLISILSNGKRKSPFFRNRSQANYRTEAHSHHLMPLFQLKIWTKRTGGSTTFSDSIPFPSPLCYENQTIFNVIVINNNINCNLGNSSLGPWGQVWARGK